MSRLMIQVEFPPKARDAARHLKKFVVKSATFLYLDAALHPFNFFRPFHDLLYETSLQLEDRRHDSGK